MTTHNKNVICFIFLILPTIVFLRMLSFSSLGGKDVGVFAYIGDMILHGQIPYRDIWDHKTPLIYYLNALLFGFFGSQFKIIAFFEVIWLFVASIFIFRLSNLIFERKVSLCISFIFATYISTKQFALDFGFTETYAILFTILAIFCAVQYKRTSKKSFLFVSGIMVSGAFLFKQTFAIIIVPIVLYLTISYFSKRQIGSQLILEYLIFILTISLPITIFYIYFFANRALADCISQVFTYNFFYTKTSVLNPLSYIKNLIIHIIASPLGKSPFLLTFGTVGILYKSFEFLQEIRNKSIITNLHENSLFIMILSWFLLDLYAVSYSGRYFGHYYLQLIPSLSLLSGYTLEYFFKQMKWSIRLAFFLIVSFLLSSPLPSDTYDTLGFNKSKNIYLNSTNSIYIEGFRYRCDRPLLIKYIMTNTTNDDFIYFWGRAVELNFFTKRRNPTKYIYLYPLLTPGYVKESDIERFISDLKKNKPKFIIDLSSVEGGLSLNLQHIGNIAYYSNKYKPLLPAIQFINNNYIYETTIEGYVIYKRR